MAGKGRKKGQEPKGVHARGNKIYPVASPHKNRKVDQAQKDLGSRKGPVKSSRPEENPAEDHGADQNGCEYGHPDLDGF